MNCISLFSRNALRFEGVSYGISPNMRSYITIAFLGAAFSLASCGKKETPEPNSETGAATSAKAYVLAEKSMIPSTEKTITTSAEFEMDGAEMTLTMAGNEIKGSMSNETKTTETTQRVSENTLRHVIVSEVEKGTIVMNGQEQPTPQKTNPLIGLPVIVKVEDGEVTAALEEGVATPEQEAAMDELIAKFENNEDLVMYGDSPRQVGDRWDVDPSMLTNFSGATGLSGTFTTQLKSVEEIDGVKCAMLECVFDLSGKTMTSGDEPQMEISIAGRADVIRSIEDLIDLDAKMTAEMLVQGEPAPGMSMEVKGQAVMHQVNELE